MLTVSAAGADYVESLRRPQTGGLASEYRRFRAYPFFDKAYRAARDGAASAALGWFAKGLARDPADDRARFDMVLCAMAAQDYSQAMAQSSILIDRRRSFAPAYLLRGLAHLGQRKTTLARRDIETALAWGGLNAAHENLARRTLAYLRPPQAEDRQPRLFLEARLSDAPARYATPYTRPKLAFIWPDLPERILAPTASPPPSSPAAPNPASATLNIKGYKALAAGDRPAAIDAFKRSLMLDPDQSLILRQLGFLHRGRHNNDKANALFRRALDLGGLSAQESYALRRDLASHEERWRLSGYMVYRAQALNRHELNLLGPSLAQSQGGLEAGWRPFRNGGLAAHQPIVYSRLLWGFEGGGLNMRQDSAQAGFGLRLRPAPGLNMIAAVERLVALGDDARNDWMLRAAYSTGNGYDLNPGRSSWPYWHVYADAALIDPADPDLMLAGDARYGQSFILPGDIMLTPFAGLNGLYQDAGGEASRVEAGPGLWLRYWFNETRYQAPRSALDLQLEYRFKLAGDSGGGSGLMLKLALSY